MLLGLIHNPKLSLNNDPSCVSQKLCITEEIMKSMLTRAS